MGNDKISIVIPVLHEGRYINSLIDKLRSLKYFGDTEIIVVDGSETSDTLKAINRSGIVKLSSPPGRGTQMNEGARRARGTVLVFLHADTFLPLNGIEIIRNTMEDRRYCAGAFGLQIPDSPLRIRALVPINVIRSRITRIPYGDQAIFFRRSSFFDLGGFWEEGILEDIDLMRRARKRGMKARILREKATTSGRRFNDRGPLRTVMKNIVIVIAYYLGVDPGRLARSYHG